LNNSPAIPPAPTRAGVPSPAGHRLADTKRAVRLRHDT